MSTTAPTLPLTRPAESATCPACGNPGRTFRPARAVGDDLATAGRWWQAMAEAARLPFQWPVHGRAARVETCPACCTLWRATPGIRQKVTDWYRRDHYGQEALRRLHDADHRALLEDSAWMSELLVDGTRVLEVGSYVGGFLRYATEHGCDAMGLDVGDDTREFCRSMGFRVRRPEDVDVVALGPFDGIWILNCFDQLPDPEATLAECRAALAPGGPLVIRTPDAAAVHAAYRRGGRARIEALKAYLWGVPFLHCFSRPAIEQMLRRNGFHVVEFRSRGVDGPGDGGWFDVVAR